MSKKIIILLLLIVKISYAESIPKDFVYLKQIDPSILQDIRYAGYHNFIGRPVKGYNASECILTRKAATALHAVQTELKKSHLSLKVYDCYRPQMAVDDFVAWSKIPTQQTMKAEFYPHVNKSEVFKLGYVAEKSGHTRGSTVDLTIVTIPTGLPVSYHKEQVLVACFAPYTLRYQDNSLDMGTGFDCFDVRAHSDAHNINAIAFRNREFLRGIMKKHHFVPYAQEWWHFTLQDEPYPNHYFNFPIVKL